MPKLPINIRTRSAKITVAAVGAAGLLVGGIIATAGTSHSSSNPPNAFGIVQLEPGANFDVTCPNAITNTNLAAGQQTVTCTDVGATTTTVPPTTTTVPATTVPPTTIAPTTVPATTTTTPTAGTAACGLTAAAFCETFNSPFANAPANSREGALDGVVWGVSRFTGNQNYGSSANDWAAAQLSNCGSNALVNPPADLQVCNGQLLDTVNDGGTVTTLAAYPKQPFDFAGRTGTIVFDVSNDTSGSHAAWPELWVTDQPIPVPFTHEASLLGLPRNGFGIRFANESNPSTGNGAGCAGPPCVFTVDSAITVANYVENDSFNGGNLAVDDLGTVTESGPGQMNHIQLKVSQSAIDVYATNAYSGALNLAATPLVHIATLPSVNLNFTRGLVYIEDAHYNGDKFNSQRNHTFRWDNVGFDGPVLPHDLTFDVADNNVPDNGTQAGSSVQAADTGYWVSPNTARNLTAPGVTAANITAASGALLTFDYTNAASSTNGQTALVNGHAVTVPGGSDTIAASVPLADIVAGTNTITFNGGGSGENIMNVDLILAGAGGSG